MKQDNFMWTQLVHLGNNMWKQVHPELLCDRKVWDEYMVYQRNCGVNTLIIDVGEGMIYDSHPELAVKGSWTPEQLKAEVDRLKSMGFEVVPKLNFSATHDLWLKDYSRMLSTPIYHQVCADLIKELCDIFKPKYFHLGMDEETYAHQTGQEYIVIRSEELWWKDFYHLVDCVERENVRPWIWSDYIWHHADSFVKKMPKSVLQSNWYYEMAFKDPIGDDATYIHSFETLEKNGYDQVPTGSVWAFEGNFAALARYCVGHIAPERLKGFMQTPWVMCTPKSWDVLKRSADTLSAVKAWYES